MVGKAVVTMVVSSACKNTAKQRASMMRATWVEERVLGRFDVLSVAVERFVPSWVVGCALDGWAVSFALPPSSPLAAFDDMVFLQRN